MKKVVAITFAVIITFLAWDYLYFYEGILYLPNKKEIVYNSKVEEDRLYLDSGYGFEEFVAKGVNVGFSKPGVYATEDAIEKEDYIRWFQQIQDMGANVIRIYSKAGKEFYDAFYEYNVGNPTPLYLLQGVSVDDYLINSIYGALDEEFYEPLLEECKTVVDIVHGRHKESNKNRFLPIYYNKDISQWVYGYIWGSEWENNLVVYTDHSYEQLPQYDGKYLYTENASNFEIFLAELGDKVIKYEVDKYGTQKVFSFTNWAFTDPLQYDEDVEKYFRKAARVDVEHIKTKDALLTGQFASYHAYPAYPDFYNFTEVHEENTYKQYLQALNEHHTMPVVIAEFGVSSSRALSAQEDSYGRDQGHMSETEQGNALVSMFEDIMLAGCNGGIVSEWQDEWYKSTWNTLANVNLDSTAYWSDYQSCDQSYGLLSFDPGEEKSICYVDGQISDWKEEDLVSTENNVNLYMKYDEKFIYFMVKQEDFHIDRSKLYIAIDTTPRSGAYTADNFHISMSEPTDFIIEINGRQNSRVWVQERYDTLSALFFEDISAHNFFSKVFPETDTSTFVKINMLMQKELYYELSDLASPGTTDDRQLTFSEYDIENPYHYKIKGFYETGLLTYGNANPENVNFNSLADFCAGEGCVEVKIPWQLLNFADPIKMYIHDDYYENYGIEYLTIDSMSVGAGVGDASIVMDEFVLKPLGKHPTYHERLKKSYYILQKYWKINERGEQIK